MIKVILEHDRTAVTKKKKERQNSNSYTLGNKVGCSHWHSQLIMFCRKKKSEKQKCAVPSLLTLWCHHTLCLVANITLQHSQHKCKPSEKFPITFHQLTHLRDTYSGRMDFTVCAKLLPSEKTIQGVNKCFTFVTRSVLYRLFFLPQWKNSHQ